MSGAKKRKNKKKKSGRALPVLIIVIVALSVALLAAGYLIFTQIKDGVRITYKRASDLPYKEEVRLAEEKYGVERARIYAVIQVESSFDPSAKSKAGAVGLMQMLPSTYEEECSFSGVSYDPENLKKPEINIDVCTAYLAKLHDMTGSWDWAHVAYFSGIGSVTKWRSEGLSFKELPSDNARIYLERIKSAYDAYSMILKNND